MSCKSRPQLVATSHQGLGAATILFIVTNSRLPCSVYNQRNRHTPAVLTSLHYQAQLGQDALQITNVQLIVSLIIYDLSTR